MAVFTPVTDREVAELLTQFAIGEFVSLQGITSGIENSNFYVSTNRGCWVLTIFEKLQEKDLGFYLQLCRHLGLQGLKVSSPEPTKAGQLLSAIQGKPCSLAPCLPGQSEEVPPLSAVSDLGGMLARMHLGVRDFHLTQKNQKGLEFWQEAIPLLKPHMPADLFELLQEEVRAQEAFFSSGLYLGLDKGAVHADLFRNNALIENGRIGGVFDFYFACTAPFLYDIAVTMNDWCINLDTGAFDAEKAQAFINAYDAVRPLSEAEHEAWPMMLRAAALRFWVSRLYDFYLPRKASLLKPHDPAHFERILKLRRAASQEALPWPSR
jgi:homoserine kinase type II